MQYTVIYSRRKTLTITIKDGTVVVRAPRGMRKSRIEYYINKHAGWIGRQLEKEKKSRELTASLSASEISNLKKCAREYFASKTEEMSRIMGLKFGRITITSAKKRYGSCSSKGNICFSYRLMLYPEAAREYVIVHELAHLVELNHSPRFYEIIEQYMPDYKERKKLLD